VNYISLAKDMERSSLGRSEGTVSEYSPKGAEDKTWVSVAGLFRIKSGTSQISAGEFTTQP
jgi:hypothetical protein